VFASLLESDGKRYSAEQVLRFSAAVLPRGHLPKIDLQCCHGGSDITGQLGWQGGAGQKIGDNVLQVREVKHLLIELRTECQVALLMWQNRGCDSRQGSCYWFVVFPKLKWTTFTKMMEMSTTTKMDRLTAYNS
jgi:hypothetical protein